MPVITGLGKLKEEACCQSEASLSYGKAFPRKIEGCQTDIVTRTFTLNTKRFKERRSYALQWPPPMSPPGSTDQLPTQEPTTMSTNTVLSNSPETVTKRPH